MVLSQVITEGVYGHISRLNILLHSAESPQAAGGGRVHGSLDLGSGLEQGGQVGSGWLDTEPLGPEGLRGAVTPLPGDLSCPLTSGPPSRLQGPIC